MTIVKQIPQKIISLFRRWGKDDDPVIPEWTLWLAQAAHETGWFTSDPYLTDNNLFGIKSNSRVQALPGRRYAHYETLDDCMRDAIAVNAMHHKWDPDLSILERWGTYWCPPSGDDSDPEYIQLVESTHKTVLELLGDDEDTTPVVIPKTKEASALTKLLGKIKDMLSSLAFGALKKLAGAESKDVDQLVSDAVRAAEAKLGEKLGPEKLQFALELAKPKVLLMLEGVVQVPVIGGIVDAAIDRALTKAINKAVAAYTALLGQDWGQYVLTHQGELVKAIEDKTGVPVQ